MGHYVSQTNLFFTPVYRNLADFAVLPLTWHFEKRKDFLVIIDIIAELLIKAVLLPILLPLTVFTSVWALCLGLLTAVVHAFSVLGASVIDSAISQREDAVSPKLA